MLKKLIIAGIALLVLLIAALVIAPSLVPESVYKSRLEGELSKALDREVALDEGIKLSTFPVVKAKTNRITIANPDGFSENDFISMDGMEARIRLLPLFSKRVEIAKFTLLRPTIVLEKRADGQVNWTVGDQTAAKSDEGPFRRDGRFTNFDPNISGMEIEDGSITYTDRAADASYTAKDVNLTLSAPGLDKRLNLGGALTYDDVPLEISALINTPKAFLSGQDTPFEISLRSGLGDMTTKGAFRVSEDIAFDALTAINSENILTLLQKLPVPADMILPPLENLTAEAQIAFDGARMSATNIDTNFKGDGFSGIYTGTAAYAEDVIAKGQFEVSLTNVDVIKPYLTSEIQGIETLKTINASGAIDLNGKVVSATDIQAKISGDDYTVNYKGAGSYKDIATVKGKVTATLSNPGETAKIFAPELTQAALLGQTSITADIDLTDKDVRANNVVFDTKGDALTANFRGNAAYIDEAISADGPFEFKAQDLEALVTRAGLDQPAVAALGAVTATGTAKMRGDVLTIDGLDVTARDGNLNGTFKGTAAMAETPQLNGRYTIDIPNVKALNDKISAALPYYEALGRVSASGLVGFENGRTRLRETDVALREGLLNGAFKGNVEIAETQNLDGTLQLDITSLRQLAAIGGTALPPSTADAPIFEAAMISGAVKGNTQNIAFDDAKLEMDAIEGTGQFDLNMMAETPRLKGNIALKGLDVRPYMAAWSAQKPEGEIVPWSDAPINTAALRTMDANIIVTTPNIVMDRLRLSDSKINTNLKDGVLTADMQNMKLYGGQGQGVFTLDGSQEVAAIKIDADLGLVNGKSFLSALAGFTKASGEATTKVSITGRGLTQADIMQSLTGDGGFSLKDGQIQGIDASEFLTGLDQALTARRLPGGLGASEITAFRDLAGKFTMENGVATVDDLNINAGDLDIIGGGQIDIGGQSLNVFLRPKLKTGSGLSSFGVPLRLSGPFGSAKAGLDTEFLGEIIEARAREKASDAIRDRVGGPVGDVLGGILGGGKPTSPTETPDTPPAESPTPVESILDGILKPKTERPAEIPTESDSPAAETQPQEETPEAEIEDALRGLFGKKKKKDD